MPKSHESQPIMLPIGAALPPAGEITDMAPEARSDQMDRLIHQTLKVPTYAAGLYSADTIGLHADPRYKVDVIVELALPGEAPEDREHLAITRWYDSQTSTTSFGIIGLMLGTDKKGAHISSQHEIALQRDVPLEFGRANSSMGGVNIKGEDLWGKPYSSGVSRAHMAICLKGDGVIVNDTSTFGTKYKATWAAVSKTEIQKGYVAEHTISAMDLAKQLGHMTTDTNEWGEAVKKFAGREIITRDSEIGGNATASVDIRSWVAGDEAIVVDGKRELTKPIYDKYLNTAREKMIEKSRAKNGLFEESMALEAIFETVTENMEYDHGYVKKVSDSFAKEQNGHRKIDLSEYMRDKKGVCRHMALLSAWLGGELKAEGYLSGRTTAEVNEKHNVGAHEWARYTDTNGNVTIIDPAKMYIGASVNPTGWDYRRAEEK